MRMNPDPVRSVARASEAVEDEDEEIQLPLTRFRAEARIGVREG